MEKKDKMKEKSVGLMGKIEAAKEMRDLASSLMKDGIGGKMKSLREVKVAADSSEGLKKGLEKAKELVNSKKIDTPESEEETAELETPEEEAAEGTEGEDTEETSEDEYAEILEKCDTPEKIDELIKKLEAKKAELLKD